MRNATSAREGCLLWWSVIVVCFICSQAWAMSWSPSDVDPIVIEGSHFFYKTNGTEFQIRGLHYETKAALASGHGDPDALSNSTLCDIDRSYIRRLRINVIRVAYLDPDMDHTICMQMLANEGIYVLFSLTPYAFLGAYDTAAYNYTKRVIDTVGIYSNTLGFYTGSPSASTTSAALAKAVIRDAKAHMRATHRPDFPIGALYHESLAPAHLNSTQTLNYFACGEVPADFFLIHGAMGSSCPKREWVEIQARLFSRTPVPVVLMSDCLDDDEFAEPGEYMLTPYERNITDALSGAILHTYNDLVSEDPINSSIRITNKHYTSYMAAMDDFTPTTLHRSELTPAPTRTTACPTKESNWPILGSTLPPTPDDDVGRVCKCMMSSAQCTANPDAIERFELDWTSWNPENDSDNVEIKVQLCGKDRVCDGTASSQGEGRYDAFSGCEYYERLSWEMSRLSRTHANESEPCILPEHHNNPRIYAGLFTFQEDPTFDAECKFLLDQAGPEGTGAITNFDFARSTQSPSNSVPNNTGSGSSLSVGANAGIGLGVAAGVMLALILAMFLLRRRKKAREVAGGDDPLRKAELSGTGVGYLEKDGTDLYTAKDNYGVVRRYQVVEVPADVPSEVPAMNDQPWELHGNAIAGELPVSSVSGFS